MTTFTLSEPTVFADLNKAEGKEANHERSEISINTLKYKHFRSVVQYPEADQMHHLMRIMTNLSEDDIGELTPNDAAGISHLIFDAMKEYMKLGQHIMKGIENPK